MHQCNNEMLPYMAQVQLGAALRQFHEVHIHNQHIKILDGHS